MPEVLRHRGLLTPMRWILALALLGVVIWQLRTLWHLGPHQTLVCRFEYLACALLGGGVFFLLTGMTWKLLLQVLGGHLGFREACRILFYSNLAKYLPGNIWNMVGRVVLAQRVGVPSLTASSSIVLELILQMAGALTVATLCLPFWRTASPVPVWSVCLGTLCLGVLLHPVWLKLALAILMRVTKREWAVLVPSYRQVLYLWLLATLNWGVLGLSFGCLVHAIVPAPEQSWLQLGSTFAIAWNIGVVALFAPAGLGVRETALTGMLAPLWNPGLAAAVAVSARVWILILEAIAFLGALALGGAQGPDTGSHETN